MKPSFGVKALIPKIGEDGRLSALDGVPNALVTGVEVLRRFEQPLRFFVLARSQRLLSPCDEAHDLVVLGGGVFERSGLLLGYRRRGLNHGRIGELDKPFASQMVDRRSHIEG
jgi:hypothetical protein